MELDIVFFPIEKYFDVLLPKRMELDIVYFFSVGEHLEVVITKRVDLQLSKRVELNFVYFFSYWKTFGRC